jgi:hypothetical protein
MSFTCFWTTVVSVEIYPTFICSGPPNQGIKCANILAVDPAYSSVRVGILLTLPAPALPLLWTVKLSAALVLLDVSAVSVVVA